MCSARVYWGPTCQQCHDARASPTRKKSCWYRRKSRASSDDNDMHAALLVQFFQHEPQSEFKRVGAGTLAVCGAS
ncbi:hypothetical protein PLICRDRAFT_41728 [Plicaturopsis crispa FD-325 SS-3]|nr:hypothetical protein PLICRDRAFT_41728 [Plicaturopsis crispa FD-325 SS-3]